MLKGYGITSVYFSLNFILHGLDTSPNREECTILSTRIKLGLNKNLVINLRKKICVIWLYLMLLPLYKILIKFTFVLRFKLDFLNLERKIAQYSLKLNRGISLRESIVYFFLRLWWNVHPLFACNKIPLYVYCIYACKHWSSFICLK